LNYFNLLFYTSSHPTDITTLCLNKISTFKLSVTLSNLYGFSKFLHRWKAHEFATKPIPHYPSHQSTLLHYLGKLKKIKFSADVEENANKLHFNPLYYSSANFDIFGV